jgi:hypothetical protein
MIAWILCAAVAAAEPAAPIDLVDRLSFAAGAETVLNDPFVVRRGLRATVGVDLGAAFTVLGSASLVPVLGDGDLTELSRRLLEDNISADITRVTDDTRAALVAWPLSRTRVDWHTRLGIEAGGAALWTVDDTTLAPGVGFVRQIHPAAVLGLVGEVGGVGPIGLRVRVERVSWVETFGMFADSPFAEHRAHLWLGVDLYARRAS